MYLLVALTLAWKMNFVVDLDVAVGEICRRMVLNPLKPKQLEALNV